MTSKKPLIMITNELFLTTKSWQSAIPAITAAEPLLRSYLWLHKWTYSDDGILMIFISFDGILDAEVPDYFH